MNLLVKVFLNGINVVYDIAIPLFIKKAENQDLCCINEVFYLKKNERKLNFFFFFKDLGVDLFHILHEYNHHSYKIFLL